ncbi:MAG: PLP-dependent aminotransferase family protein [Polyangiaceae bacterium]
MMNADLGLALEPSHEAPLYQQLFDQIVERIRSGGWPPGFKLPPTRQMAAQLGAHRNTVVRAYEELVAAGYVESLVGRGTFVAAREQPFALEPPVARELPWGSLLAPAADAEPLRRLEQYRRAPTPGHAVNLSMMQPSPDLLPHKAIRRCLDHVLRTRGPRALGYAPREGVPALREQIAAHLVKVGVPARAEDVIVTTGSQQAIDLIGRALVSPGDRFLTDGMTYTGALNLLTMAGGQVVGVPSDAEGPDMRALELLASRGPVKGLYLMPNNHNPTGRTIGAERRRELIAWSHRSGLPLVEDDYGADIDLDGEPAPPYLRALDGQVIYVSTFSKKLIPALRVGFVLAPRPLTEVFARLKHAMDLGTSALLQHALAEFLERGYLKAHYQRVLPEYRRRRDVLVAALDEHLPDEVTFEVPRRGLVLWLSLPTGLSAHEAHEAARRAGVIVSPSTLHAVDGLRRDGLRLSYCHASPDDLALGAQRLGKALSEVLRRPRRTLSFDAPQLNGV